MKLTKIPALMEAGFWWEVKLLRWIDKLLLQGDPKRWPHNQERCSRLHSAGLHGEAGPLQDVMQRPGACAQRFTSLWISSSMGSEHYSAIFCLAPTVKGTAGASNRSPCQRGQKLYTSLLFIPPTPYWLSLRHNIMPSCKGSWKIWPLAGTSLNTSPAGVLGNAGQIFFYPHWRGEWKQTKQVKDIKCQMAVSTQKGKAAGKG